MTYGRVALVAITVTALVLGPVSTQAQQTGNPPQQRQAAPRQGAQGQNRVILERQVRARIHRVMRDNLQLDDEQLGRLENTMTTFEGRRRALLREERQLRLTLRDAMGGAPRDSTPVAANEPLVASALDSLIALQRRRIDLIEAEQRELAAFLTPLQRARYFALQDNLRRILEEGPRNAPGRPGVRRPAAGQGEPPPR